MWSQSKRSWKERATNRDRFLFSEIFNFRSSVKVSDPKNLLRDQLPVSDYFVWYFDGNLARKSVITWNPNDRTIHHYIVICFHFSTFSFWSHSMLPGRRTEEIFHHPDSVSFWTSISQSCHDQLLNFCWIFILNLFILLKGAFPVYGKLIFLKNGPVYSVLSFAPC